MGRLSGKVAIITGAARGMGASHARLFVEQGARVVLTDLNVAGGEALAKELGDNAMFVAHDVTKPDSWETVVAKAVADFGTIDILVNNAGILGPMAPTAELDNDGYDLVCAVNQHSVFYGMKAVLPAMVKAARGSIVNISSIAGMAANYGFPSLAYVASKFAVRGMTQHPGKFRPSRLHPDADDGRGDGRSRRRSVGANPARAHCPACRGFERRAVPRLR